MRRTHQSDAEVFHLPQQKSSRKLEEFKWASETRKCQQSGTVERRHFTALDRCGQYENDEVELIIPYCPAVGNRWQLHSHYKADLSENCVESVLRRNAIVGGEDRVVPSDLIPQRRWTNPWQSDQNRFVKPTWDDRFRENFHCNQVEEEEWVYKRRTAANWGGKQRLRGVWRTESYAKAVGSVCYEDLESTDCEMPSATEAGTESSKMTDLWNANGNGCENSCVKNKTLIIVGDPMGENSVGATNNFSTGRYRKKNDSGGVRWRTKGFPRRKLQVISTSTWSSELERSSKWPLVDITAEEKSQKSSAASIAEIYGSEMSRLTPPTCQGGLDSSGYCVSRSLPNCLSIGETNVENKSDFNGSSVIVGKEKVSRESAVHIVISEPTTSAQSSGNQWKTVGGGRLNDFLVLRSTSGNPSPPGDNFSVEIGRSVCRQNYSADNKLGLRHNCGEEKLTAGPSVTKEKQNVLATYISSRRVENGGGMSASTAGVVRNHFSDGQISRQCQGCPDPNVVIVGGESVPTRGDFPSPLSSTQQRLSTLKEMPIRVDISLSSRNPSTVWVQSGVAPFGFDTELLETPMFHTRNGCGGRRRLFSSTAVRPDLSGSSEVSREETDRLTIISDSLTSTTADPSGLLSHSRDSNGHIATGAAETEEANFGSTECPLRPELGELMSSKHAELTQFVIADDLTPNRVLIKQNLSPQFGLLDKNAPVEAECQLGPTQLANIEADTTANDNTAGLSSSSSSSSNLLKSTCATTTADEVELSVGTKEFQVDSPGRRMRATEESNRSEVTERNGSAICTSLLTPPAVVGGNRTDRILAPRKTAVTSAAAAAVTTTTLSAASFIPGKLTPRPDVVTISSEKIGFIPTCSAGKLTPPDNTDELSCSLLTTSALSTTTATKMKFPAEVRLGTDEILISDADGVVCVAGTAGSRSPLCGVPPTFLLNSPAAVEVLNSSVGSVDGFEIHSVVDQYDVVGADRDLTGQYNKRGSLVEALDNPRTSTDSTSLSLRSSTESTIMDSRPMSHFDNEDGVDTDGVILRYQSVPSYCRNRNGREIANSALVRPVSAALVDYENYACYDAHGEIEVPPSGSGINQPTSMTGISVVDESFNRLLSNNLPPKGVSKTRDPFSRLYHKLTANRSKLGEEKQSHSGRTSPLRSITAPIGRMFGNYTGATNAGSKTAAVEIEENSIRDVRKIRRSNTFTSLEPVKCKRFDFVKETAELLDVATHQRRPPVVRPLSKASGTGSGSMEKLPVKTRNTSDSSVQRYLDGIYGGSAAVVHPGINRNLSVNETQLLLGETNAEPLESIQLRLPNSSATTNKTSKWIKAGGSARTFNPAALAQLQNRRRLPLANGTHKMSTVVVVNECVNPLLVHNFSGGPTDRKVSGGGGTPTLDLPARLTRDRNRKKIPSALPHSNKSQIRRAQSQPLHINKAKATLVESASKGDVFDDVGKDDGISSSDDISDAEFSAGHSPRCTNTPDNRNSIYSTTSSVTASSFNSENVESSGTSCETDGTPALLAEAIWDHVSMVPEELPFAVGDVIEVVELCEGADLWYGYHDERYGWFPASYVRLLANQDSTYSPSDKLEPIDDANSEMDSVASTSHNSISNVEKLNQTRANVVREIICTERDYVKLLEHLVDGFLRQAQRRSDMFSKEKLTTIFGNLEDIFFFHKKFLGDLENCIIWDDLPSSRIGDCFLRHEMTFDIYSHYCNNQPQSVSELAGLYQQTKFRHFFEACRLLRDMTELSLDGFLLTPVQRICKYPLQLGELVKCTTPDNPDFEPCKSALEAMKRVATAINDKKRRIESLQKLAVWQTTIDGWQGPDVLNSSCSLIGCGEVNLRCSNAASTSFKDVTLFLFDHLIVFCRKDLLKRSQLVYKDRLYLQDTHVIDIQDGKDPQFGVNVKYGIKLVCEPSKMSYLILLKSKKQKQQWLKVFHDERSFVAEGKNLPPSEEEIRVALTAVGCQSCETDSKRNPKNFKKLPDLVLIPTTDAKSGLRTKKWSGLFSQANPTASNRRLKV